MGYLLWPQADGLIVECQSLNRGLNIGDRDSNDVEISRSDCVIPRAVHLSLLAIFVLFSVNFYHCWTIEADGHEIDRSVKVIHVSGNR